VKRFLLAAGLATAIHGVFLWTEPGWLKSKFLFKPGPRTVTLTLAHHKPARPEVPLKKPVPVVKKKEQKHTPVKKPQEKVIEPQKPAKPFPQPDKNNLAKMPPETTHPSEPKPPPIPEQPEMVKEPSDSLPDFTEDILEEEEFQKTGEFAPGTPGQVMRKARPIYRKNPKPEYPSLARRKGYEGTVVLEALVDRNGRVSDLRVLKSSGYPILDRSAIASVKEWLFEPGMRGDEKTEMWVKIPVRFELK